MVPLAIISCLGVGSLLNNLAMESNQLTKSEGISAALLFIKAPPQRKEDKVAVGRAIIDGLVNQAGVLKERVDITNFCLGGLISLWKEEGLWKETAEYEDWWQFGDFCKKVLKMSLQKANDLSRLWDRSIRLGVEPETVDRVGWGKAIHALRAAKSKEEARVLLKEAEAMGQEQFIEKMRAQTGGNKFDSSRNCRKLFLLTPDERDFLDETIEYAANVMKKDLGPEVSASEVLVFILTDWRVSHVSSPDKESDTDEIANKDDEWFQAMSRRALLRKRDNG